MLACAAIALLWILSWRGIFYCGYRAATAQDWLFTTRGTFGYSRFGQTYPSSVRGVSFEFHRGGLEPPQGPWLWEWSNRRYALLGFAYERVTTGGYWFRNFEIPYWPLLVCVMLLGGISLLSKEIPPGQCRSCGYDLRATPDRCPECGTAAAGCAG